MCPVCVRKVVRIHVEPEVFSSRHRAKEYTSDAACGTETPGDRFGANNRPLSVCFRLASAQPSNEKPNKAFWPREVRISEDVKVERKTKYGLVTSKRHGSVVKVVSLDSDSLRIESDGFQGRISVEKTDFGDRAEKTRNAPIKKRRQRGGSSERSDTGSRGENEG